MFNKYGNKKTTLDGMTFDSRKEAKRYRELELLERAGEIADLKTQVKYELIPAQYVKGKCVERAVNYVADFVYTDLAGKPHTVVEDTKSTATRTKDYIIKRKLMLCIHGIQIKEV